MNALTQRNASSKKKKGGFTLLELIVVITIIGLLGTLVVVKVGGVLFKANSTKVKSDLKAIVNAANMWKAMKGYYPESIEDLVRGVDADGNQVVQIEPQKDPWGNEYFYTIENDKPVAYCYGMDGQEGGEGDNQDYVYPEPTEYDY